MIEVLITSSVLILTIFLLRIVTRGKISMRLRYALWLVAVLRLLMPVSIGNSTVSVMNLFPAEAYGEKGQPLTDETETDIAQSGPYGTGMPETGTASAGMVSAATAGQGQSVKPDQASEQMNGQQPDPENGADLTDRGKAYRILGCLWIVGVVSVGGYMAAGQIHFVRILRKRRRVVDTDRIPKMFRKSLQRYKMTVYTVKGLGSPCLVGRDIYIHPGLMVDEQRFVHVLAHEYCHARQHDALWAFIRSALAAVYWFHPLVWAAAFAARQDSELACDEAVIRMLGEEERFDYGRTLLYLLTCGGGQIDCAGTALTMEGRKKGVKERVRMIAGNACRKRWLTVVVLMIMLFACGCAFTGSSQEADSLQAQENGQASQEEEAQGTEAGQGDAAQVTGEGSGQESARIRKEHEDAQALLTTQEKTLAMNSQEAAFFRVLNYQDAMAGRDDSELALDRKIDYQAYYQYRYDTQDGEGEQPVNPLENGWYLLCRSEQAQISLYGLYTEEFGCRGIKTLIGEDVNTYDISWCPGMMNEMDTNIRTLEEGEDGLPRSFVFQLLRVNTSEQEIWNLYSGFRYDTGTVQLEELTAQTYRDWVDENLAFTLSEDGEEVLITYDTDMVLEPLDISAYQDQKVEAALISTDVAGFRLFGGVTDEENASGQEEVEICLALGLKLEGQDEIWFAGLHPLIVQVLCQPEQEEKFVLQNPRIDEKAQLQMPAQEQKLQEIREGTADGSTSEQEGYFSTPLVNSKAEGHHDLEIIFTNPCPAYDRISDWYGERTNPVTGQVRKHNGVDMAAAEGTDIVAAADGQVYETGFDVSGGNYVVIWHGQSGQMTYYMHCKDILVSEGDQVRTGDRIATVGKTGQATGSHLHFAISYEDKWQEPSWDKGQVGEL